MCRRERAAAAGKLSAAVRGPLDLPSRPETSMLLLGHANCQYLIFVVCRADFDFRFGVQPRTGLPLNRANGFTAVRLR